MRVTRWCVPPARGQLGASSTKGYGELRVELQMELQMELQLELQLELYLEWWMWGDPPSRRLPRPPT